MLRTLNIENIAVIEKAEIEFSEGLNVLTGETGAGKSIVIDSLEAALGWRTSAQLVRTGAKSARVTAAFSADGLDEILRELDLEAEDGEVILTRRITEDGKSTCRVNGVPVPAASVRRLGLQLMDIHGQGDGQRLTDERYHREYLDAFGGLSAELEAYRGAYSKYRAALSELEELNVDEAEKARRLDMLTYQINELERADLKPGEFDEKSARRTLLKNSGKLTAAISDAAAAMLGGERSDGALSLIEAALGGVEYALKYSDGFSALRDKLRDLKFSCEDAAYELRDMKDGLDFSPEELDELDDRLDTLKRILRKYGGSEEAALEFLENAKEELKTIENSDARREELEAETEKLRKKAEALAAALTEKRKKVGEALADRIEAELQALSMKGAVFFVSLGAGGELGPYGRDEVRFMMSANAGEAPGRISKVASGGELSRVMLAMKSVLSENDPVDAMVFDEIDTGVSGIAARRVAEKLAGIAAKKQVICVTHLPQIASMADVHFSISKELNEGRTYTRVERLDGEGRKLELARLTGGDVITETTLKAAEEQLDAAEKWKKENNKC
ncbi:MAG: DNA repair protein RecN [Oscillospiraceae bacterium]|nr:DNA repair protein RecN [Oscillospiraceae bacterium]